MCLAVDVIFIQMLVLDLFGQDHLSVCYRHSLNT